ncbi:MAG: site-specific integrase [Actinomycetaceae bacterium]|nr:site-specific integrase [Actinomycetaceae bacterium]
MPKPPSGTVRRLPSGRYQARYTAQGVTHKAPSTFARKIDAQRWLAAEITAYERGEWTPPAQREAVPERAPLPTLGEWVLVWLEKLATEGASPNSIRSYTSHMRRHIVPVLGGLRVDEVTRDHVQAWWDGMDPARPMVRLNAYRALSALMGRAVNEGLIEETPVKVHGATARPKRDEAWREARERVATPSQVDEIAAGMPEPLRVCVILAAWCGLRYGEIAGLQRRDIDFEAGVIRVRRAVKRDPRGGLVLGPPKSERSRRDVPIPGRIVPVLRAHLEEHTGPGARDHVVTNRAGHLVSDRSLLTPYRRAVDKVPGLEGLTFHQLRATCASQLMATGATPVEIMAILGHSDWSTSLLYQRAPRERLVEAMRRLSEDAR